MGLELRPLPSAGVTRPRRYYEPLRHPGGPAVPRGRPVQGQAPSPPGASRVALIPVYRHAVVITPVARWVRSLVKQPIPAVYIARQRLRPSPPSCRVGVHIGHFEACSTFTRVTACLLAAWPGATRFSRRLRRLRYLHRRSDSYRLERPSCRVGIAPTEDQHLSRAQLARLRRREHRQRHRGRGDPREAREFKQEVEDWIVKNHPGLVP